MSRTQTPIRIAVVGTGGVGGYFGGRLALTGHEVHFIARGAHLAAIQSQGLRVSSTKGDFVVNPANATSDPTEVGAVDLVIFAVKTWQLGEAASSAHPLVNGDTTILPLLNGVEAAHVLSEEFGKERVIGGLCRVSAQITAPGHVTHGGIEPTVVFGELDDARSDRVTRLRGVFVEAGVRADVADRIAVAIWEKFMLIASWSGVGAITRAPIGVWRDVPEIHSIAEGCVREIHAVARAQGVELSDDAPQRILRFLEEAPPEATASMQRDIVGGRPSEIEAQSGAVVRMGALYGVPTPNHRFIHAVLLPQELAARGRSAGGGAVAEPAVSTG